MPATKTAKKSGAATALREKTSPQTAATRGKGKPPPVPAGTDKERAVVPVAAFLVAKLISHTLLGAALGAFGAVLQPSPQGRALLLIGAGALMVVFALDLLGVGFVHRFVPRPPAAWGRLVRRSSRTESLAAPAGLGFLTVLIPCGVTLSVELLAITSGSMWAGAAIMAGFVLGTMPLFAVLGYVLRRSTKALQGWLTLATGAVVLVVALWTVVSGLRVGGWFDPSELFRSERVAASASENSAAVVIDAAGRQTITLDVGNSSYQPANLTAKAGTPTTLVLRTSGTNGCTRGFVIPETGLQQILPETGETSIDLGVRSAGVLEYTCSMGMYSGSIDFTGGTR